MNMEKKLKKSDQITKNAAYEAVAPDDFASMIEVDRYEQRASDFDKIISDTHAHFWDPLDTKYFDFGYLWNINEFQQKKLGPIIFST